MLRTAMASMPEASAANAPLLPKNCELPASNMPASAFTLDDRKPNSARASSPSLEGADEYENTPPGLLDNALFASHTNGMAIGALRPGNPGYRTQSLMGHGGGMPANSSLRETGGPPERHAPHQGPAGVHGLPLPDAPAPSVESPRMAGTSRRNRRGDVASSLGGAPAGVRRSVAESDLELARALQEQENAYYALSLQRSVSQPIAPARHGRSHSSPLELGQADLATGAHAGSGHAGAARHDGRGALRRSGLRPADVANEVGPPPPHGDGRAHGQGHGMATQDTHARGYEAAAPGFGPSEGTLLVDEELEGGEAEGVRLSGEGVGGGERAETSLGELVCAEDYDNDEAFARALQEAEDRQTTARMLALQGLAADGDGNMAAQLYGDALRQGFPLLADQDQVGAEADDQEGGEYSEEEPEELLNPDRMTYEELIFLGEVVGVQSRGASSQRIASLIKRQLVAEEAEQRKEEQCAICRMEFEAGDGLSRLPCTHEYHTPCIEQWLGINKACPVCFKELEEPAI